MSIDLSQLVPALRDKLQTLLDDCAARSVEMRPYFGLRDPFTQAKLWRQSRTIEEIDVQIAQFRAGNANFLADCLESVGPQNGDHVTDAPPGLSWHQWGEAVDSFWVVDGQANWSTTQLVNGENGYQVYAEEATAVGLTPGGLWPTLKDWPHVQLRPDPSPGTSMSLAQIDAAMSARFGSQSAAPAARRAARPAKKAAPAAKKSGPVAKKSAKKAAKKAAKQPVRRAKGSAPPKRKR